MVSYKLRLGQDLTEKRVGLFAIPPVRRSFPSMKRIVLINCSLLFFLFVYAVPSFGLPAQDIQLVLDAQYVQVAQKMIKEAKKSIQVMMFDMRYYDEHPNSPSNLLIKELIGAKKRGVKVEVILEIKEEEDRTTLGNRRTGKILSDGGVGVIYDPAFKTTHTKVMVVDGELTLLGSANWTYHALTSNNEVSVLIRSKELAKEIIDYFNRLKTTGSKSQNKE
jgi:phosphatidylserine/phosphatidylglycerophosphate/cardiolipin synthase-like enzyme